MLVIVGGVVRSTGSGLACPDWPLCHGRWFPVLEPHVLLEWSHRALALIVSLWVVGLAVGVWFSPTARTRLGGIAGLGVALLVSQVALGALTVTKLLDPSIVTLHLVNALTLLAAMIALRERAAELGAGTAGDRSGWGMVSDVDGAGGLARPRVGRLIVALIVVLGQIALGGLVSSSHAGLACPDFPGCHGQLVPPLEGRVGIQMAHRYVALALVFVVFWAARGNAAARDSRVRTGARAALSLSLAQVVLGAFNVLLALPVWLTAAHLATAATLFAVLVVTSLRAGAERVRAEAGRDEIEPEPVLRSQRGANS